MDITVAEVARKDVTERLLKSLKLAEKKLIRGSHLTCTLRSNEDFGTAFTDYIVLKGYTVIIYRRAQKAAIYFPGDTSSIENIITNIVRIAKVHRAATMTEESRPLHSSLQCTLGLDEQDFIEIERELDKNQITLLGICTDHESTFRSRVSFLVNQRS